MHRGLWERSRCWLPSSSKAVDTFAPSTPGLVTLDEIGDLGSLGLRTCINGRTGPEGNTSNVISTVASVVAWLSWTITLPPGGIIATGTASARDWRRRRAPALPGPWGRLAPPAPAFVDEVGVLTSCHGRRGLGSASTLVGWFSS